MRFLKGNGLNKAPRQKKVIATLTSFPDRIDSVWITIETIMNQKQKADEIYLWLARSQFPNPNKLPKILINQVERGLKIRFCDDIKSHKKYYYTMKEHPNDIIITFDDDFFYPKDTISKLLNVNKKYPKNIICSACNFITEQDFYSPIKWGSPLEAQINSDKLCINSGAGTLFPPQSLHKEVFNQEIFTKIAPNADDLWLTLMAYAQGTKINCFRYQPYPITIKKTQDTALFKLNTKEDEIMNNNDQWKNINEYYYDKLIAWRNLNFKETLK